LALPPTTPTDDAFIREVDEEVRRDQLQQFWTRYGRWLLVAIGLFLILLAAFLYWREERQRDAGETGAELVAALAKVEAGDADGAQAALNRAAQAPQDGYRAIGLLLKAGVAARAADTATATKLYAQVAADDSLPQPFRDFATLRSIMLGFDAMTPAQAIAKLKPLATKGSPWFGTAGELLAIAHLRDGKPELAGPIFAALAKDETVPQSIRGRATQMASSLGIEALPTNLGGTPAAPKAN